MPRLCDIEGRALAMGYYAERTQSHVDVCHIGLAPGTPIEFARWRDLGGFAALERRGELTSVEVEAIETGMSPGRALIVTVVAILRVGTGGGRGEAIRQGERLANELAAKGYLEALAGLAEPESVREDDIREETPASASAHDIDF